MDAQLKFPDSLEIVTDKPEKKGDRAIPIDETYTEELIIGLCGPVGSPIHKVADAVSAILSETYSYECKIIKLSDFIRKYSSKTIPSESFLRISTLISEGDALREKLGADILARLAIKEIFSSRPEIKAGESQSFETRRTCFIIDSIKNQFELDLLKSIYRELFYFIGVFSPLDKRRQSLLNMKMSQTDVHTLIDKDSGEETKHLNVKHGQTVEDTFHQADFFLRLDNDNDDPMNLKLARFFNLVFNTKIITPTSAETAMYYAASAASNSACLSRQVGACLTDSKGEILSVGWNDVPRFGGGLYRSSEPESPAGSDHRCMNKNGGTCFNDVEKSEIAKEIADALEKLKLTDKTKNAQVIKCITDSKVKYLIEFSRAVHAEMYAVITGAKKFGDRVTNGVLYCTTFPCHSCARHLIAAGIHEVYYIEPYPKSLALRLHDDAITQDPNHKAMLRILAFDGVAPNRFLHLFRHKQNNRKGTILKNRPKNREIKPKFNVTLESLPVLEGLAIDKLKALDGAVQ
jgi:deoxycytidylate deaminase